LVRKHSRVIDLDQALGAETEAAPTTLTGDFRHHEAFHSSFLQVPRDVLVYLPPGYDDDSERRFPVLYMHDGQNLFDGATSYNPGDEWCVDETAEELITNGTIKPLIIVGIYNTGEQRVHEYTPSRERKYNAGGKANLYGRLIVEELKPFIDARYRTLSGPHHTAMAGSSLGGLLTLYLGLRYPGEFGKLGVMSPAVWWDRKVIVRHLDRLTQKPHLKIWLDIGTEEGRQAVRNATLLRDKLISKGWREGRDLAYLEAQGALHNETAWSLRVGPMLEFLFPAADSHRS